MWILGVLNQKATDFDVDIAWDGWLTDNLKLTQTILDNIPGVNDGTAGNETVFTDAGIISTDHAHIDFNVVDGTWKADRRSPDTQRFELNPEYEAWYSGIATTCLNSSGNEYERIRYGDSEVKQNQAFDPDWLTVSEITSSVNTVINGYDNTFTLDGDLLINFVGHTPSVNEEFTLMTAGTITSANIEDLFDNVKFGGYTPGNYRLEVEVSPGGGHALVLTILEEILPVAWLSFEGVIVDKAEHLLTWETAFENDNAFFELQRSSNGREWVVIGTITGVGRAEESNTYQHTDVNPLPGVNLYRLRQVDLDGTFDFSSILQLIRTDDLIKGEVYPNPFTDELIIPAQRHGQLFSIFSIDGREITKEVECRSEEDAIVVKTGHLPAGSYLVRYGESTFVVIKK